MDDFILNWLNANKQNAWMAVPVLAFLEACPGVGLLVSGVILLTVSTVLYTEQIATLSQIVPLAFVGACLSDHIGFYLGRWIGPKFHQQPFAIKRAEQLQKAESRILSTNISSSKIEALILIVPLLVNFSALLTKFRMTY